MLQRLQIMMKSTLSFVRLRVTDRATARELELIGELRANCKRLPDHVVTGESDAQNTWSKVSNYFRYLIATEDPRRFLTWPHLQTMVVGNEEYVEPELIHLKQSPDWLTRWSPSMAESSVGQPLPYPAYPQSSGNLIHHAYHLCRFEEVTGKLVDEFDFVAEFGGGYGGMCRLFHRLGFDGRYLIFDFPEFSCLQQFFLKSLDLPVQSIEDFRRSRPGIVTVSDLVRLKELANAVDRSSQRSLFVATWSLSETSVELRREVLDLVSSFDAFLLAYQDKFGEVDNDAFFTEWKKTKTDIQWHHWPIEHIPGSYYLMGQKTNNR